MIRKMALITTLSLSVGLFLGCQAKKETAPVSEKAVAKLVQVEVVKTRKMVETLDLTGTLRAENVANILSTVEGKISCLLVREGDQVEPNQVVAMISSLVREDIINAARLRMEAAKRQLNDNPENPQFKVAYEQAQQDYEFAVQQYKEIPVTSPMQGLVSRRWVDLGDMVPSKAKLFEIQSSAKLIVDVPVSELDLRKLKNEQKAKIFVDACPEKQFQGAIQRIHPQVDAQTRNGLVEIILLDPCPNLKSGMFVRVTFDVRTIENAIAVPVQAIIERPQYKTCFIVNDDKAQEKIITTGLESGGWVEILSGLSVGEKIVIEGQQQLKTGSPVKIKGKK